MNLFATPAKSLGGLDAQALGAVLAATSDVALILDKSGVVRDMAVGSEALARELGDGAAWVGLPWASSVAADSRVKVEEMMQDAATGATPRWRHVNHPGGKDGTVPILYTAVPLGTADGRIAAVGRDQRHVAALHERLVSAQSALERDYARLRHNEARYRLLFQLSSEAMVVLDPAGSKVLEANPAAERLAGAKPGSSRTFLDAFAADDQAAIGALLSEVRFAGRAADLRARLERGRGGEVTVAVSPFRQDGAALLLVRLLRDEPEAAPLPNARPGLLTFAEVAPDGIVVTGADGRILNANAAFLEMAQLGTEEQARGEPLDRWLGRPGVEFDVLVAHLRTRGAVRLFATTLRGEHGVAVETEVSAVPLVDEGAPACFGFAIRDVGARLAPRAPAAAPLQRPVEQLSELVGRVPLKELVREATDVIERFAIEAALEMTDDNRASAAEMLGLSRQSLYVKLRRYGLGDPGAEEP